jgi:tRNA 2-selenouridine synthase SelU
MDEATISFLPRGLLAKLCSYVEQKEAISLFDDFCSGSSKERLSLDPNLNFESLQLLLDNGLATRFPDLIESFNKQQQRLNEEQQIEQKTMAEQNSILVEAKVTKAESLLRRFLLHEVFSTYPYALPFKSYFPH